MTKSPLEAAKKQISYDALAAATLCGLALVYFFPVLLHGNRRVLSSIDGDTWSQFFYWRRFAFESLSRCDLPLWNPYNFSGQPFVGAMQSAIFYPPNWLFFLVDTPLGINLSIAIHCLGASIFTYLFARYLGLSPLSGILAGVTFAYGAPYFLHIYPGHLPHLAAMWLPLMFLGMAAFLRHEKFRFAIGAGVCLAMEILAGYPQYSFYCAIAVSIYFIAHLVLEKERRSWARYLTGYALFAGVAVLLAAVQLVPAWEMVQHSARGAVSLEWVSIFSLPPENLLTLILPNIFGDMVNVPYWGKNNLWEMSVYLGVVPLPLMIIALVWNRQRQVAVFAIIGGGFLLLALGKHTPFLSMLYSFVPGFSLFRGVGKAAFVFAFCVSILTAFGFEVLRRWLEKGDKRLLVMAFVILGTVIVFSILTYVSPAGDSYAWSAMLRAYASAEDHFESLPLNETFFQATRQIVWNDVVKLSIVLLVFAGICGIGNKRWYRSSQVLLSAVVLLAIVDLWHFSSRFVVSFDPRLLFMDPELKTFLRKESEPYRIATPLARLRNHLLNAGMIDGIENVGGYDAIVNKRYNEFINLGQGLPLDQPNLLMGINRVSPLLNLLNVKYYLVEPTIKIDLPDFDLAFENSRHKLYRSKKAQARTFLVHQAQVAAGTEEAARQLVAPGFDPASTVVLDEPVAGLGVDAQPRSPAPRIVEHSPKRVIVDAAATAPGLLILADSFYPGWRAFVANREVKIYRANHAMRAVFLPPGRHRVEFRYDPLSFKVGAVVTATTLIMLFAIFLGSRLWRRAYKESAVEPAAKSTRDRAVTKA